MACIVRRVLISILMTAAVVASARAEEPNCVSCHEDLTMGKSVHAAVTMGCAGCHTGVDAADVPHKFTGRNPKGLSSKLRDLCYGCHDRQAFMKKTVHGAIALGCSTCHNPHASDHGRLLKEDVPALCITCHEEQFTPSKDRNRHALAGNEACSSCHDPHASDAPKLMLTDRPTTTSSRTALAK